MKKVAMIIAQHGFQDIEYNGAKKALEANGIRVDTVSVSKTECIGKYNGKVMCEKAIKDINMKEYDALVLIGGPGAPSLANYPETFKAINDSVNMHKITAAICIAPTLLAKAGVLKLKKATVWNLDNIQSSVIEREGAIYVPEHVIVDGRIITADGPDASKAFGEKIAEMLVH
jgi:protease I